MIMTPSKVNTDGHALVLEVRRDDEALIVIVIMVISQLQDLLTDDMATITGVETTDIKIRNLVRTSGNKISFQFGLEGERTCKIKI